MVWTWQRQLQDFDLDKSSIIAFSKTIWEDALQRLRHSNWDAYHQLGYPLIYPICHDMCWIYDLARWIYARFLFQSIQLWISFHGFNTESIKYLQTNTFVETWWFLKSLSSWFFLNMNLIVSPFPGIKACSVASGASLVLAAARPRDNAWRSSVVLWRYFRRGTIVFEQNLRWRKVQFLFSMRLLRDSDSDDISCYVCNSGPDMPCILRRTTTWNPLPLTIFDSVCGGCWF